MITNILAQTYGINIVGIIVSLIYGTFTILVIIGLVRLVRFLGSASREMKLTRMEMGKLAEEVHILRENLKNENKDKSLQDTG
jgi:hypothetical protein